MRYSTISKMQRDRAEQRRINAVATLVRAELRKNDPWTQEEDERLMQYWRRGYSLKGLVSIMGRTYSAIDCRLRFLRKRKTK